MPRACARLTSLYSDISPGSAFENPPQYLHRNLNQTRLTCRRDPAEARARSGVSVRFLELRVIPGVEKFRSHLKSGGFPLGPYRPRYFDDREFARGVNEVGQSSPVVQVLTNILSAVVNGEQVGEGPPIC
jgi:hypothetical protein